jgi:hypothetical protein
MTFLPHFLFNLKEEAMFLRILMVVCFLLMGGCNSRNTVNIPKVTEIPPGISFSGGSGESFHDAIKITGARDKSSGIAAEYKYISDKQGARGTDWFLVGQTVIREKSLIVDVIEIQLKKDTDRRIFYFDVSDFMIKKQR